MLGKYSAVLKEIDGVRYEPVIVKRSLPSFIASELSFKYVLKNALRAVSEIEKNADVSSYDIIHAHGMFRVPAGIVAFFIAEKYRKPYILTLHGSDVNYMMKKWRKKYIPFLERAARTIFVSNALLERAKQFGYSGKNAMVVPNGFDPDIFKPLEKELIRKELGIYSPGYKYVGFVGNLNYVKRADKLTEIFLKIAKSIGHVKFIVVGDGQLRRKLEKSLRDENLEAVLIGRVSQVDVAKYMNAMDVMILPSRNEGFGAVVIEAQACGTCVVGSNNGGIPEAIGFEEHVVEEGPDFEERFTKKVVEVLRSGYDRQKIVQRAQKYTWEYIVKMEKQVYEAVLQEKKKEFNV
ncbi:glycosyltransferase [Fervidobacterium ngatamarikiense]|uniref:glycosyltransferase n=1 Tax=Fervidobacterium ngatamarikiense TaxID=3389972 RepID=UPI000A44903E